MKEFTVKIKPLTPIWTGDANRKSTTLRETGIIGSLRWWYEALIRGLGGDVCDPTNENSRCKLDHDKFYKAIKNGAPIQNAQICQACQLFGCTGWARKFRLEINEVNKSYAPFVIVNPKNSIKPYFLGYYDNSGNEYMNNGGFLGEYELNFVIEDDKVDLIKLLLLLSTKWGFGAGVQKGFGIVFIKDEIEFSHVKLPVNQNNVQKMNCRLPLPGIDKFFFYRIPFKNKFISEIKEKIAKSIYKTMIDLKNKQPLNNIFSNYNYAPTSPWVRHSIRALFKNDEILRHFMMGFVGDKSLKPIHLDCWQHSIIEDRDNKNKYCCTNCKQENIEERDILEKTGSKIFVSHIYNKNAFAKDKEPTWEIKICGWIPDLPEKIGGKREDVKFLLQSNIESDKFWKNMFGTKENPVIMRKIWGKWDIDPRLLLDRRDEFYE